MCKREGSLLNTRIESVTKATVETSHAFESVGEMKLPQSLGISIRAVEKTTKATKLAVKLKQFV